MNWIQKHALSVLMRNESSTLKQMKPDGVDANLFSYHIHYLKTNKIIESISRGKYRLTPNGMHVAGKFNSATGSEARDVKSVIVLYARRNDGVLLFQWSRHPYFGFMTLPHDRYNFGKSLDEAIEEAVSDKLHLSVKDAQPKYFKSGMININHAGEQISCMSAHVYTVSADAITSQSTRNGTLHWVSTNELSDNTEVMRGMRDLVTQLDDSSVPIFEATLSY